MTFRLGPLAQLCGLLAWACVAQAQSTATLNAFGTPRPGLRPDQVAVVVNEEDPTSVHVGERYREARGIPEHNLIHVRIPGSPRRLTATEFDKLRQAIDAQADSQAQVLVLAWTTPYAVECQSITAALTLGLEPKLCEHSCAPSRLSPYFDSDSVRPRDDFGFRLTMLLPSQPEELAQKLIERGVRSDRSQPRGNAFFLITSDTARSSRARFFPPSGRVGRPPLAIHTLKAEHIENERNVMFYETGAVRVDKLETLGFLPGALADHLTSTGGDLLGEGQMSALRWLEAGATATYGTVSEPCNHWQKFPNPTVLLKHYLRGESAVEAYWKSVAWPAQGLFVGEPLASPYRR
jgi:uncharacterized protein (TIGR03790 family)